MKYSIAIKTLFIICLVGNGLGRPGAGDVWAQGLVAARVLATEGQVEIRRQASAQPQAEKIAFKVTDELKAGDTIVTGRGGRLVLGLADGSQAVIAPQTTVVIQNLSQSPRTLFHVLRGKTRVRIEKLGGRPNPYRVNTPTAIIAVRGTIFDVLVKDDETQVFLHEGEVAVINLRWPDQPTFLTAGQTTRVAVQRPPSNSGTFKAGRNDGDFRIRRDEGRSEENRRTASAARPDSGRGNSPTHDRTRGDSRRDHSPSISRANERGGPSMNSPRPNDGARGGGRRP